MTGKLGGFRVSAPRTANGVGDGPVPPANTLTRLSNDGTSPASTPRACAALGRSKVSTVGRLASAVLVTLAVLAATLSVAVISVVVIGFTYTALFIAGVTAAAFA